MWGATLLLLFDDGITPPGDLVLGPYSIMMAELYVPGAKAAEINPE